MLKMMCSHCGFKQPTCRQTADGRWVVKCNCGMNTGPCKTEHGAWSKWNNRVRVPFAGLK